MKRKFLFILAIIPFLATSCGEGVGNKTFYIDRTEEVTNSYEDDTLAYSNHAYYKGWSEIKPQLDLGNNLFVILTQTSCSHCNKFKNTFVDYCKSNSLAYGVIERNGTTAESYYEYHAQVDALNAYYNYTDDSENYIESSTPSIVGVNSSKAFEILGGNATTARLTAEMKKFCTYTNVYHSRTVSSIKTDALTYLLNYDDESSASFYKENLISKIRTTKKTVNIVDYSLMDEENKNSLLDKYDLKSFEPLLIKGDTRINVKNDSDAAESLIKSSL